MRNTDRIGSATLNTNQNIAGALARLGLGEQARFLLWVAGLLRWCSALTVWAARRVLRAGEPVLALICVALFGLVVSPVSWSHHWVWVLPTVLVTGGAGLAAAQRRPGRRQRRRGGADGVDADRPDAQAPRGDRGSLWRQLAGVSYVWWALAVIVAAGATVTVRSAVARATRRTAARCAGDRGRIASRPPSRNPRRRLLAACAAVAVLQTSAA